MKILGVELDDSIEISSYVVNSQDVRKNSLFFALPGERVDGQDFLEEVAARGAACAVVSREYTGSNFGLRLVRVPCPLRALQDLAKERVKKWNPRVIGVTGSVGKTTTKEFISSILEGKFSVTKSYLNQNSQIGMPLSILNGASDTQIFVQEMGMSEKGELLKLVEIAPPEVVVITKIAVCHMTHFESIEEIAEAKSEILCSSQMKIAVVNDQVMQFPCFQKDRNSNLIKYGVVGRPVNYQYSIKGFSIEIQEKNQKSVTLELPFKASHLMENFLAAAVVARFFNMTWEEIAAQCAKLKTIERRFESIERGGIHFINDCYNANPESMKAALINLPEVSLKGGKKVGVLGEMLELGKYKEDCHIEIGKEALLALDILLCYGSLTRPMVELFEKGNKPVYHFESLDALRSKMQAIISSGDVVLIKGSNGNKLWKVLEEN